MAMRRAQTGSEVIRRGAALAAALIVAVTVEAARPAETFPKLANIYFPSLGTADLERLSRWDMLVLPKRAQELHETELQTLRTLNPDIVLLVHMPLAYNGAWESPTVNADLTRKLDECDWWMRDTASGKVFINSRDALLNVTTACQTDESGDRLCDWLPSFIAERMGPEGHWDGVYLDFCMDWIDWLNRHIPCPMDADRDGVGDGRYELDASWRAGTEIVVSRLRELVGDEYIIASNGNNTHYEICDGSTREDFPNMHGDWYDNITNPVYGYLAMDARYRRPSANIVNAIWRGTATDVSPVWTPECERTFRFTLASALVFGDGFFSFDGPSHCQAWWHEYYDVRLGSALGRCEPAAAVPGERFGAEHADMIRLRRFDRGVAVVNPTLCEQEVSLGGTYYDLGSWSGAFYEAGGARTSIGMGPQDGEILAGSGRALAGVGGLLAKHADEAAVISWNPIAGAKCYSVYRWSHEAAEGAQEPTLLAVVETPSYRDATAKTPGSWYVVAPIDSNDCEGRRSCPVEASSVSGSDLSLALMVIDELDGTPALTWALESVPQAIVFDIVRTDEWGMRERLTDAPLDPRRVVSWPDRSAVPGCSYLYEAVAELGGAEVILGATTATAHGRVDTRPRLLGCYPQPTSAGATIAFDVPVGGRPGATVPVSLTVYDVAGRVVSRLPGAELPPGRGTMSWAGLTDSGERVASGCYLYDLRVAGERFTGRLVVAR